MSVGLRMNSTGYLGGLKLAPRPFVTTWNTTLGTGTTVSLPINGSGTGAGAVDALIDWGDGTTLAVTTAGPHVKTYGVDGTYIVSVTGVFGWSSATRGGTLDEKAKLVSVDDWGTHGFTSLNSAFRDNVNLASLPTDGTGTDRVTDMTNAFNGCTSLVTVPLFNTLNVTSMSSAFNGCTSLTGVPLFDTRNVTTLQSAFQGCTSLTTVPLFDTVNMKTMRAMFSGCGMLSSVPLFNTSAVTLMLDMFLNCTSLTTVPLFDTPSVLDMSSMFSGCTSLTSVPLFNTANVWGMASMFAGCTDLTTVPLFNTASATTMDSMFSGCTLFNTDLSSWSVWQFQGGAPANFDLSCPAWVLAKPAWGTGTARDPFVLTFDTTLAAGMTATIGLSSGGNHNSRITWGDGSETLRTTSGNVLKTYGADGTYTVSIYGVMTQYNSALTTLAERSKLTAVNEWGDTGLRSLSRGFEDCVNLTGLPAVGTGTAKVTDTSALFERCTSLVTVPLFDVGKVLNAFDMFNGCTSLTTVPLFSFSSLSSGNSMFRDCTSLTTIPLIVINTNRDVNLYSFFDGCINLTSVPLLDTSSTTDMRWMFRGCTSLTTVPNFDTAKVTAMTAMFSGCTLFNADLSSWNVALIPSLPTDFDLNTPAWVLPKPVWGTTGS